MLIADRNTDNAVVGIYLSVESAAQLSRQLQDYVLKRSRDTEHSTLDKAKREDAHV